MSASRSETVSRIMLTFPLGTVKGFFFNVNVPAIGEVQITELGDVSLHFSSLCTEFNHDAGATTFTGSAYLTGAHYQGSFVVDMGTLGVISTTLSVDLTAGVRLFVFNAAFDTSNGTGNAELAGSTGLNIGEINGISLSATFDNMSIVDATGMAGSIAAEGFVVPGFISIEAEARPFWLEAGVAC